jgi:alpha-D-xyloside xylohydrolase
VKNVEDFNFLELGNAYGLYHSQGIYEGQRGACDKKRVVNLTRSGYTGQQKYGTILWNGDVAASWETMRKQIIAGLHLTACGLPYWTLDIGAFFVKRGKPWFWAGEYPTGTQDLAYRELYTRWFQYGAFLPVFRAHGTDIRREVWEFGKPGEIFYEALCEAIRLRYQLIPYIYSLAGAVYLKDETMMRFLAFEFPNDPEAMKVSNQYMFGPAFMVCPITGPMYYQVNSNPIEEKDFTHRVYLPAGINWYDFWTNRKYQGGRWVTITADISRIPLFIREGSIIPMTETMNYVEEKPRAEITLHVYPGCDGEFLYYDDEGDGYGYEEGEYRLIQLEWNEEQKILTEQLLNDYKKIERKRPLFVKAIEDSKKLI